MNNIDYRITDKCLPLKDVQSNKVALETKIKTEHKRASVIYNFINKKYASYYRIFLSIFHCRCAYCGASLKFTDINQFEVDHYICEDAFPNSKIGRAEAGKMENLVLSCYSCNRGKKSLHLKDGYETLLKPDNNSIANVFLRDSEFYIQLEDKYKSDLFIKDFYEALSLGSEVRRIDYLLLEMNNLLDRLMEEKNPLADKLGHCIKKLMEKKHCTFS